MESALEVRDPIHGFILREPHELKIIDRALFQRLRRVKQLALASLVYPGAVHTRFEHSLGAMHVAGRIAKKLKLPEHEERILRLAALLHDVGHGPFSHVSEDVLRGVTGNKQAHEELTTQIILTSPELDGPLSGDDREEIAGLLKGDRGDSLRRSILSGPLDVDKQDYLLRDSYFCGVKYGIYDIDRLVETLRVSEDKGNRELAISEDGVLTLEQFVIARYHMTGQVYRHRVRLITDSMVARAIELGIESDGLAWLKELYSYDGSSDFLEQYLKWDDERLARAILECDGGDGYACSMFQRLANRQLFKQLVRVDLNELDPIARKLLIQEDPIKLRDLQKAIEKELANSVPDVDKNLVIARILRQPSAAQTEGEILVQRAEGPPRQFRQESALFRSIDPALQDRYLDVYAPITWADAHDKKRKMDMLRREIVPRINEFLKAKARLISEPPAGAASNGGTTNGSE